MIKTLETNVAKGKFIGRDGQPSIREYTFYVDEDVSVGDVLEVFTRGRNSDVVVTRVNVDPAAIEPYKDVAKTLMPKPREIKIEEESTNVQ